MEKNIDINLEEAFSASLLSGSYATTSTASFIRDTKLSKDSEKSTNLDVLVKTGFTFDKQGNMNVSTAAPELVYNSLLTEFANKDQHMNTAALIDENTGLHKFSNLENPALGHLKNRFPYLANQVESFLKTSDVFLMINRNQVSNDGYKNIAGIIASEIVNEKNLLTLANRVTESAMEHKGKLGAAVDLEKFDEDIKKYSANKKATSVLLDEVAGYYGAAKNNEQRADQEARQGLKTAALSEETNHSITKAEQAMRQAQEQNQDNAHFSPKESLSNNNSREINR